MTSSELIKVLQKYDPNTEVGEYKYVEGRFGYYKVFKSYSTVELNEEKLIIY